MMDASRLVDALRSLQGGGDEAPPQGRYRYGGAGGEPMMPQGQVQMDTPDPLGALLASLFGGGFGGGDVSPAPTPEPSIPAWQERGFTHDGNMAEKNDILRSLLGQLG
jgi:hypothetical protein